MKNLYLIIIFLCGINSAISQEIEILEKSDSIPTIKESGLSYINSETDTDSYYFIAKVKITSENFTKILEALQKTAIEYSANAFKFVEQEKSLSKTSVVLNLFSADLQVINSTNHIADTNTIYFFGNDKKPQTFKINGDKIELKPNEIFRYDLPKNEIVKINKGGITGMTVYHQWRENQPVIFYAFGSGNLSGFSDGNSIGLSISNGSILELKSDYAYLLLKLKK